MLRALWEYRVFIGSLVRREFQLKSARAIWGSAWLVLEPAAQIVIYTLIFGRVLGARLPGGHGEIAYGVYVCAGLITWNYFAELVTRSQTLFIDHAGLLKSMRFPRSTLPVAMLMAATINLSIITGIFLVMLLVTSGWPGLALFAALPLVVIQGMLGLGIGMLTGSVNVFFRDVGRIVGVVMQFWFWLTPIVYPVGIVPESLRSFYAWNPLFPLVTGYQRIAVEHQMPEWGTLWPVALLGLLLLGISWVVFRRLSPDLVDEL